MALLYRQQKMAMLAGALFVAWSLPSLMGLANHWQSASIEHGYAPALMSLVLAVLTLRRPLPIGSPGIVGIAILVPLIVISSISHAISVQSISQFLWPVCLYATLLSLAGWRFANRFVPSILFLYFAIPFWQDVYAVLPELPTLRDVLQALTVFTVSICVRLTGIPALIEGNFIILPSGTFEVARSCSGLHYFIIATELALFYGFAFFESWRNRWVVLLLMTGLAIAMNWIRVFSLVIIGFLTDMESSLVADHDTFGWILFSVVLLPMFFIGDRDAGAAQRSEPDADVERTMDHKHRTLVQGICVAVLAAGIFLNIGSSGPAREDFEAREGRLPRLQGWQVQQKWVEGSRPLYRNIDEETAAWLRRGDVRIAVYRGDFIRQRQGAEAVNASNRPQGRSAEKVSGETTVRVMSNGLDIPFRELQVADADGQRLIWYSMQVAGTPVADLMRAKLFEALGRIRGRADAQVIVISSACATDCTDARENLSVFAEEAGASLFSERTADD